MQKQAEFEAVLMIISTIAATYSFALFFGVVHLKMHTGCGLEWVCLVAFASRVRAVVGSGKLLRNWNWIFNRIFLHFFYRAWRNVVFSCGQMVCGTMSTPPHTLCAPLVFNVSPPPK